MRRIFLETCAGMIASVVMFTAEPVGASEPIRVGFLGPQTGLFAQVGKDMLDGLKLSFEQAGYQAAGRKIELIEEDDEGVPATALAKYRKLVAQDRIHVLTGVLLVNIGYALVQPIERDGVPTLYLTTPDDLTKRRRTKSILRVNISASQPTHALGDYAAKTLRYRRVATVGMDNGFGHEQIGGFQRAFEELGGSVVQKIWVPLNAVDFAPYLTQITRDVDAVLAVFVGGQSIRFVRQYSEHGLKGRIPLLGGTAMTDENALTSMGAEAVGVVGAVQWSAALDIPANRAFVRLAEGRLGKTPTVYHATMYSAGRYIIDAAAMMDGQVENRERFLGALRRASERLEDPRGPRRIDEYGNPTQSIYIVKVERVGGKLQNTVIHTYPMVSQFWNWKPDDFLKSPPYARDYPPLKP